MLTLPDLLVIIGTSITTATLAAVLLGRKNAVASGPLQLAPEPLALLFDNGVLHHGTAAGLKHFGLLPGMHLWDDLRDRLLPQFPDLPETAGRGASGSMTLIGTTADPHSLLEMKWRDGLCWIDVTDQPDSSQTTLTTAADLIAYKRCCDMMPHPAWEERADGSLGWRNRACDDLLTKYPQEPGKPPFDPSSGDAGNRAFIEGANGQREWFDIERHQAGSTIFNHATCITSLVASESAENTFVQTLAKTFAHLSIGLAIFDRRGQLGIFNPALVDLTGLQPRFLASQPTMQSFFDQLRENRSMPEPKNYRTWRQEIAQVIAAASGGQYRETWTLEDGRTYAVQGRPHPDGATAFMIKDISPEITLTRNFRIEVEVYEAMINSIDDALVVFSSAGIVTFSNAAYRKLWGHNPETSFADVTIHDAIALWKSKAKTKQDWATLTRFTTTLGPREPQELTLQLPKGVALTCRMSAITSDTSLIRFAASKKGALPDVVQTLQKQSIPGQM
jgi:PAS domain-containing protein